MGRYTPNIMLGLIISFIFSVIDVLTTKVPEEIKERPNFNVLLNVGVYRFLGYSVLLFVVEAFGSEIFWSHSKEIPIFKDSRYLFDITRLLVFSAIFFLSKLIYKTLIKPEHEEQFLATLLFKRPVRGFIYNSDDDRLQAMYLNNVLAKPLILGMIYFSISMILIFAAVVKSIIDYWS